MIYLVRGFYELDDRLLGTLLLTFSSAVLKLDKVKEFWLPASLRIRHDGGARLSDVFFSIEEALAFGGVCRLNLHGLCVTVMLPQNLDAFCF